MVVVCGSHVEGKGGWGSCELCDREGVIVDAGCLFIQLLMLLLRTS